MKKKKAIKSQSEMTKRKIRLEQCGIKNVQLIKCKLPSVKELAEISACLSNRLDTDLSSLPFQALALWADCEDLLKVQRLYRSGRMDLPAKTIKIGGEKGSRNLDFGHYIKIPRTRAKPGYPETHDEFLKVVIKGIDPQFHKGIYLDYLRHELHQKRIGTNMELTSFASNVEEPTDQDVLIEYEKKKAITFSKETYEEAAHSFLKWFDPSRDKTPPFLSS